MSAQQHPLPQWLPSLMDQIDQGLQRRTAGQHDQRPALEQELKQIEENIQGWSASLANPRLPPAVREGIETRWAAATERQHAIEAELSELVQAGLQAEQPVRADQVFDRLDHLAGVLAANNPTRGNLELSLHIDRIICCRDGKATLRMCKLGIIPDAVEMLSDPAAGLPGNAPESAAMPRARRRGKLRVVEEDGAVDLRAQAIFIANPNRFAGLGDEWFWADEFQIPRSACWARDNAEAVFKRRQESRWSNGRLAAEFEVSRPTIAAAIRYYLESHPDKHDEVTLPRGGKRPKKFDLALFADEALTLWRDEGRSKLKLAEKYGCSTPVIDKALAFACDKLGQAVPSRKEAARSKAIQASQLLEAGHSLEEIAAAMQVSDVTARQFLRNAFAAEGKAMPDLRRREGA